MFWAKSSSIFPFHPGFFIFAGYLRWFMSFSPIFLYFDWFSINKWMNYFYFSSVSPMFKLLYEWNFFLARWIFLLWDFFIHKIRVAKGGTQLSGCQIAQSRSYFPALCNTLPKWQTTLPAFHHEPQPAGTAKISRVITYLTAETVKRTCTAK